MSLKGMGNRHSQHSFAQVPTANIGRSAFNRSFATKDTFDFDELTPIMIDEVLPGDTLNLNVKTFARLATQTVPVLDNMYIDYFFFFVPNRLVWDNWEKFNGAQDDPGDSIDFTVPTITINDGNGWQVGSIYDKLGIPTDVDDLTINALPLRAYNLIYNEWFRDQNLIDSITVNKDDGPDASTDYVLKKRGKRHDYFTSCLPWPQKGDAVELPLGTNVPVVPSGDSPQFRVGSGSTTDRSFYADAVNDVLVGGAAVGTPDNLYFGPQTGLRADLSEATAATINLFRQAMMVQSLLELDARGGTRYVEIIKAHFNVVSPDFRLQRPEFLSGGTSKIVQHPIPQTSETGTTAQANLASYSTSANMGNSIGFSKSFTEHGYIIGLAAARADLTYQQGLNKMWSRSTRYDFFWPKLQQLGEQAVLNKEIYAQGSTVDTGSTGTPDDERVFGYQERYAEYRYKPSEIKGQFRSTYSSSLDVWHLAEEFSSAPALNETFINSNTPIERSLAVTSGYPHILFDAWFQYKAVRPMMTYGVPATLGRF
jgi:hypothetical protein